MNRFIVICLVCVFRLASCNHTVFAQQPPKSSGEDHTKRAEFLKEINRDIWIPFEESFRTGNVEHYVNLYSRKSIHFSGREKKVEYFSKLSGDIRAGFANRGQRNIPFEVDVRFNERIVDSAFASERGVFKATIRKGQQNERITYTVFHTFLSKDKDQGMWKIIIDYDSQEPTEIAQALYERAFVPNAYDKF